MCEINCENFRRKSNKKKFIYLFLLSTLKSKFFLKIKGIIRKKDIGEDYAARELFASKDQIDELKAKAQSYHRLNINKVEAQWAQTLSEGWAHPLRGFMNEDDYLTCLHFNYIKRNGKKTFFLIF